MFKVLNAIPELAKIFILLAKIHLYLAGLRIFLAALEIYLAKPFFGTSRLTAFKQLFCLNSETSVLLAKTTIY
ncbi:hypothetical protein LIT25_01975 [Bacillus sp. F19]|nr:hypothetical protein LIT25_01975 [Bacillus sp. F19]